MVKDKGTYKLWQHNGLRMAYVHYEYKTTNDGFRVRLLEGSPRWMDFKELPIGAILEKNFIKTILSIDEDLIDYLVENNTHEYNLHKASEEFQELSLILTQKLLKSEQIEEQAIIDEIGDAIIRLEILKKKFPIDKIQARIDKKSAEIINNKTKYKNN